MIEKLEVIGDLFESLMFDNKKLSIYSSDDIANILFLTFLACQILKSEYTTSDVALKYLYETAKRGFVYKPRQNSTDLYWMINTLLYNSENLNNSLKSKIAFKKLDLSDYLSDMLRWCKKTIKVNSNISDDRRFFLGLEKHLNIHTSDYKNIRVLVSDWNNILDEQKQLAVTRLLFALKRRAPRLDILIHLEKLAKNKHLAIVDANNPEYHSVSPTKDSILLKTALIGGAFVAPLIYYNNKTKEFKKTLNSIKEDTTSTSSVSISSVTIPFQQVEKRKIKYGSRKKKGE